MATKTPPTILPPDNPFMYPTTVLPRAIDMPTSTGPRDTTALMNPMMDEWLKRLATAEGQVPDEQGVTHLTLSQAKQPTGSPSLSALKGLM